MRTLPAAWQAAADAGAAAGAHQQRVLLRVTLAASTYLWLSLVEVAEDDDGLGAWEDEGAWGTADDHGPYAVIRQLPPITGHADLETLTSMSNYLGNMVLSNASRADLLADLGVSCISDLPAAGFPLAGLDVELYVNYVGCAWADRLTFALRILHMQDRDLDNVTFDLSDVIGEGNVAINRTINGSPIPIVLGGGSAPAIAEKDSLEFSDRSGLVRSGGAIPTIRPNAGAPWANGDRVTFGSGTGTVASIAGTTDADTVLTLTTPMSRTALDGELDLTTSETGYHVPSAPTSAAMSYSWADEDFSPVLGRVAHLPPGGSGLLALPSYCGTPTEPGTGRIALDKRPRFGGALTQVWADGDSAAATTVEDAFRAFCEEKFGLVDGTTYEVATGSGLGALKGRVNSGAGSTSALEFLRQLEINGAAVIRWDGSRLKLRDRRSAAEIAGSGPDAVVTVDDMPRGFPGITDLPATFRESGIAGCYDLTPGLLPTDAKHFRGKYPLGSGASSGARSNMFWLTLVTDQTTAEAVLDRWFELVGPMSDGSWPGYIAALVLGPEFMKYEAEDVLELVVFRPDGSPFEGLDGSGTRLWRVISKHVAHATSTTDLPLLTFSLAEVHR